MLDFRGHVLLSLSLVACTPPPGDQGEPREGDTDTGEDTGEETGGGGEPVLARGCDTTDYEVVVGGGGEQRVLTEHYDLLVDASADAEDLARLLEAAWQAYAEDLGAEPPVEGRLEVALYPDQAAWEAALQARGIPAPAGAGGYYDPGTRLASLYRQPTLYYTETLLLHEAFHQFHLLSRTLPEALPGWYIEGLAEWVSRHDWDGACVAVGADPRGTLEDPWGAAMDSAGGGSDLAAWIEADAFPGRPEMMAFVHHQERDHRDTWRRFREGMDFGTPPSLAVDDAAYAEHIRASQEPLLPIWLEWQHRTPAVMRGMSPGAISAILYKELPEALSFEVPYGDAAYVGGVVGWSEEGFDVVFVDAAGSVSRWIYTDVRNEWVTIAQLDAPGEALWWEQTPGGVLTLDGQEIALEPALPAAAGFALYDGEADFTTLSE